MISERGWGGEHFNMKVMGMCLPENENMGHSVGFGRRKGFIGCGIQKNLTFFSYEHNKQHPCEVLKA